MDCTSTRESRVVDYCLWSKTSQLWRTQDYIWLFGVPLVTIRILSSEQLKPWISRGVCVVLKDLGFIVKLSIVGICSYLELCSTSTEGHWISKILRVQFVIASQVCEVFFGGSPSVSWKNQETTFLWCMWPQGICTLQRHNVSENVLHNVLTSWPTSWTPCSRLSPGSGPLMTEQNNDIGHNWTGRTWCCSKQSFMHKTLGNSP